MQGIFWINWKMNVGMTIEWPTARLAELMAAAEKYIEDDFDWEIRKRDDVCYLSKPNVRGHVLTQSEMEGKHPCNTPETLPAVNAYVVLAVFLYEQWPLAVTTDLALANGIADGMIIPFNEETKDRIVETVPYHQIDSLKAVRWLEPAPTCPGVALGLSFPAPVHP